MSALEGYASGIPEFDGADSLEARARAAGTSPLSFNPGGAGCDPSLSPLARAQRAQHAGMMRAPSAQAGHALEPSPEVLTAARASGGDGDGLLRAGVSCEMADAAGLAEQALLDERTAEVGFIKWSVQTSGWCMLMHLAWARGSNEGADFCQASSRQGRALPRAESSPGLPRFKASSFLRFSSIRGCWIVPVGLTGSSSGRAGRQLRPCQVAVVHAARGQGRDVGAERAGAVAPGVDGG